MNKVQGVGILAAGALALAAGVSAPKVNNDVNYKDILQTSKEAVLPSGSSFDEFFKQGKPILRQNVKKGIIPKRGHLRKALSQL